MNKQKLFLAVILALAIAGYLYLFSGPSLVPGTKFETMASFDKVVSKSGFVIIGRFNLAWPAEIVSSDESKDEITLRVPGLSENKYPGFTGYNLKAIVLKREDGLFSGFVLRSKEKQ